MVLQPHQLARESLQVFLAGLPVWPAEFIRSLFLAWWVVESVLYPPVFQFCFLCLLTKSRRIPATYQGFSWKRSEQSMRHNIPFQSKLLPAVLLLLRIYFPKITVTVTVLKFGWIHFNYHYRYHLGVRSRPFISIDSRLSSWKSCALISQKLPLPLPSWNVFQLER